MNSALASGRQYGLTDKKFIAVVESLARHQGSGAKMLLPTKTGTKEIELPSLAKLRGVRPRGDQNPVDYAGEVTGFDQANDVVILDGKIAVEGYRDSGVPFPVVGDILRINGTSRGKLILEKVKLTANPGQMDLTLARAGG